MKESFFQGNKMEEFSENHERINFEKNASSMDYKNNS